YKNRLYVEWTSPKPLPAFAFDDLEDADILVVSSDDLGKNWTDPVTANEPKPGTRLHGWLSVDPTNGTVAVTHYESDWDLLNARTLIVLSNSDDGGATFTNQLVTVLPEDESCFNPYRDGGNNYGDYTQNLALGGKYYL